MFTTFIDNWKLIVIVILSLVIGYLGITVASLEKDLGNEKSKRIIAEINFNAMVKTVEMTNLANKGSNKNKDNLVTLLEECRKLNKQKELDDDAIANILNVPPTKIQTNGTQKNATSIDEQIHDDSIDYLNKLFDSPK